MTAVPTDSDMPHGHPAARRRRVIENGAALVFIALLLCTPVAAFLWQSGQPLAWRTAAAFCLTLLAAGVGRAVLRRLVAWMTRRFAAR